MLCDAHDTLSRMYCPMQYTCIATHLLHVCQLAGSWINDKTLLAQVDDLAELFQFQGALGCSVDGLQHIA